MDEFAMHRAAEEGDLEGVKRLIERGVSVDSRDTRDRTPLHWAAERGRYEVADLLISHNCNVNRNDRGGLGYLPQLIVWNREEGCYAVLGRRGMTPLTLAAERGHADVAALLLRAGAHVNRRDELHWSALHRASVGGHIKVVQVLLGEGGLDLNPQDDDGDTPLHQAVSWGRSEVVKQLLTAGADTNIKNNDRETALSFGIRGRNSTLEEVRLFVQHGFFFEDYDYALILKNPVLKDLVLKDVELCTQSIANRFHRQSLPALYNKPDFAEKLPSIEKFKLSARQVHEVENFVKCDIETNKFCNIVKARPLVLGVLCVYSLLAYQSDMKRSASPSLSDSNSPLKKTRHN